MEDAAVLSNFLHEYLGKECGRLSATQVRTLLERFTTQRIERMKEVCHTAQFAMRLHARDGVFNKLFGRYLAPYAGDMMADTASRLIAKGPAIAFVTAPQRSGPGWVHFGQDKPSRSLYTGLIASLVLLVALMVPMRSSMIINVFSHLEKFPAVFD